MWEKTAYQRLGLIVAVLLVGLWILWPPKETLKPGQDIAGGVSMIFEINEDKDDPVGGNVAEQMKTLLAKRVDPSGVYDLVWRVVGKNRIEVRMPLPPKDAAQRRQAYQDALEELAKANIQRSEIENAVQLPAEQRAAELETLAAGRQDRLAALQRAAQQYDEYRAAKAALEAGPTATSQPTTLDQLETAERDAEEFYLDAVDSVLATNLEVREMQRVLDLDRGSPAFNNAVKDLKARHPNLTGQIDRVVAAFTEWKTRAGRLESAAELKRLMKGAGVLEFRILALPSPENLTQFDMYRQELQEQGPHARIGSEYAWFPIDNPLAFFNIDSPSQLKQLDPRTFRGMVVDKYNDEWYVLAFTDPAHTLLHGPGMPSWKLKRAAVTRDEHGKLAVRFFLDPVGGSLFQELTSKNINRQLAIFLDDTAYSSANIQSAIRESGIITGNFSREKVAYLEQTMQAGSLPAKLKETPVSERTIGSTLGETNLQYAFRAGVIGLVAVIVVMLAYYLVAGAIADVALLMNIVLVLAAMAMLSARITLAGIAGIVLSIGMAVDANVLIFERMREEKARGSSLRMVIKNGYDKALSTIVDANITTLLTCLILYYIGSEEIKGFGLTLGWGIVLSLFTALFVTRTIFALLVRYNLIRDIKMLNLFGTPNIDWYSLRKIFVPTSAVIVVLGMVALYFRGTRDLLDVEFRGGVSAEVELVSADVPAANGKPVDRWLADRLETVGAHVADAGRALKNAQVAPVPGQLNAFQVSAGEVESPLLAAMLAEPLEDAKLLERDGIDTHGSERSVTVRVQSGVTSDQLQAVIRGDAIAGRAVDAGQNLARANIGSVLDVTPEDKGRFWNIVTTVTNKRLVQYALTQAAGEFLEIQPRVAFVFRGENGLPYPVTDRRLNNVVPGVDKSVDVTDYLGGAAMYFDDLQPAMTTAALQERLENMRLQPGYQDYPYRPVQVVGVQPSADDPQRFSSVVVLVADPSIAYSDDPQIWATQFAAPEVALAEAALDTEQSLRRVTQFKPQIAAQSQTQATIAIVLSWLMIIAYMWVRFGRPIYGVAGVVALIHDVLIALAFVGFSGAIGGAGHPIGEALLIEDFKIDMTIVAAFLTIVGYSINDTIVVFDRIREMRGRLGIVTPRIINEAINQTLSRTVLTSGTTLVVLLVMYIFGGSSIRGFSFCMIIGILTGTYSSIAIAAPLLMLRSKAPREVAVAEPATA